MTMLPLMTLYQYDIPLTGWASTASIKANQRLLCFIVYDEQGI